MIAGWGEPEVTRLLADPGIVRHRGKIEATIGNARAYLRDRGDARGSPRSSGPSSDGAPQQTGRTTMADVPAETAESRALSKALKARGFRFCGPTIVYAWMQASGLVNDHVAGCFRHAAVGRIGGGPPPAPAPES